MSVARTVAVSLNSGSTQLASTSFTNTQESELNWNFTLTASSTNYDLPGAVLTIANIKNIYMCFDTAVTLKTNSTGSPQETLVFAANVPLLWDSQGPLAIGTIFAGNITKFYLTNSAADTACRIYILLDA